MGDCRTGIGPSMSKIRPSHQISTVPHIHFPETGDLYPMGTLLSYCQEGVLPVSRMCGHQGLEEAVSKVGRFPTTKSI